MKQHFILPNADGSGIQIMEVVAQRIRFSDGKEFPCRLKDGLPLVGFPQFVTDKQRADYLAEIANGSAVFVYPTPEECVAKWPANHPQPVNLASKRKILFADIPTDRTFRAAWKDAGTKIDIHMPTARNIWRDRIREARAGAMAALDAEYMRADEAGDAQGKKAIAAKKQALRDAPADPAIEAATTPEQLKTVWIR